MPANNPAAYFMNNPMYQENRPRYDMDPLLAKLAEATVAPPAKTQNPLLQALATSIMDSAKNMGGAGVSAPAVPNLPAGYTDGTYGEFTDPQPVTFSQNPAPDVPFEYKTLEEAQAAVEAAAGGEIIPVIVEEGQPPIGYNVRRSGGGTFEDAINAAKQILQNAQ
tara:strand:+ start:7356 stop:7850 length:495 start_codon:yes stop_codon:yes gene_type:complete